MATKRRKLAWYTATRNGIQGKVIPISRPHASRAAADALVADPGARDRDIACALDPRAHFAEYLTVGCKLGTILRTVVKDPRAIRILRGAGIEVPA